MNKKLKKDLIQQRNDMDDAEVREIEKRIAARKREIGSSMKGHLETFNDGVIAIFITIMVLEIPYPSTSVSMHAFRESLVIFLVSFFVVADFWYELQRSFMTFEQADHWVVVTDFLFLAALALIPIMTKWIMNDITRRAVINFGMVYLVTTLLEVGLFFAAHRRQARVYSRVYRMFMLIRVLWVIGLNGALIILAFFYPKAAMYLFLSLPVVSFFFPNVRMFSRHRHRHRVGRCEDPQVIGKSPDDPKAE